MIRSSSAVEQVAVNHKVEGSNPFYGANETTTFVVVFIFYNGFEPLVRPQVAGRGKALARSSKKLSTGHFSNLLSPFLRSQIKNLALGRIFCFKLDVDKNLFSWYYINQERWSENGR